MSEFVIVVIITTLATMSPGADFTMVTRNSLVLSRRAGVLTACGIATGISVHVGYTLLGIGIIIHKLPMVLTALKLIGAAYLTFLGIQMVRSKPSADGEKAIPVVLSDLSAFKVGFLTNALNPKSSIFVVSLFMQAVQPSTSLAVQFGYAVFIMLAHLVWFSLVAVFFSASPIRNRLLKYRIGLDRVFGLVLFILGITLAGTSLSS